MEKHLNYRSGIFAMATLLLTLTTVSFTACQKSEVPDLTKNLRSDMESKASQPFRPNNMDQDLDPKTLWELQQVRAATAKYKDVKHALADGFQKLAPPVPNMGQHFINWALVNADGFDLTKPEILVYEPTTEDDGSTTYELVAVEYGVTGPVSGPAPDGFTGTNDVWSFNRMINLWTLHAWIWVPNPNGVFKPFNPDVFAPHTH